MGLLRALGKPVRIAGKLTIVALRIAWMCTFGLFFAGLYVAAGFLMHPFGMLYGHSGNRTYKTAISIWTLTPAEARES